MVDKATDVGRAALWVGIVVLSSISLMLVVGSVAKAVDSRARNAYLIVEQVYFESSVLGDDTYDLTVKAYVTNDGDEPAEVRVSAFVKDPNSQIVFDSSSFDLGPMKGKTTGRADMKVSVDSERKYVVEVIAYKDGKVAVRGSATVDLAKAGAGGEDYKTVIVDDEEDGGGVLAVPEDAAESLPFPALAVLLPAILAMAILIRRRKG
jgi:hypothetical protein